LGWFAEIKGLGEFRKRTSQVWAKTKIDGNAVRRSIKGEEVSFLRSGFKVGEGNIKGIPKAYRKQKRN